jgi:pilus assembly protein CpaE
VVDDIVATRFNLAKLISFEPDMEVIAHAGDGREALRVASDEQPDFILMDICMPGWMASPLRSICALSQDPRR